MLGLSRKSLLLLAPLLSLVGCSSEGEFTANVAGTYTVALTNGASSCNFQDWEEGKEATGVGVIITQDGSKLQATVEGVAALFFNLAFGSADFSGEVHQSSLTLTNYGQRSANSGDCAYTYNATIDGELSDNAISGTITYSPATNGNPDCSSVECRATQQFSGSRPPPAK